MDELVKLRERVRQSAGPDHELAVDISNALEIASYVDDSEDFTSSIDAALALCERALPYMWLEIKFAGEDGPKRWPVVEHGYRGSEWRSQAATAPLAIILAVLTALLEKEAANEAE